MPAGSSRVALRSAAVAIAVVTVIAWLAGWYGSGLVIALAAAALLLVASGMADRQARQLAAAATQERQAGDERDRQAAQWTALLAAVPEAVLVVDRSGTVTSISRGAEDLLAVDAALTRGKPLADGLPWPQLAEAVAGCLQDGDGRAFEGSFGDVTPARALAVNASAYSIDGRVDGVVVVLSDLSRLRQLEEYRRDFVANVSHELKTPLAAIQGFVETLVDDPAIAADTRQRFLQKIARQTERLSMLVGDLLVLSRLDEDRGIRAAVEPCDLVAVVRQSLRDLQLLGEGKGLQFTVALPAVPVPVRAEAELLRQVVDNLVDNAIKYTPAGGRLRIGLQLQAGTARFEVVDTGIGLLPEDQQRVFERFYRVDKARSRELGGTGLGLSIVKNTVLNLGGRLGLQSELGRGSTFWVELPTAVT